MSLAPVGVRDLGRGNLVKAAWVSKASALMFVAVMFGGAFPSVWASPSSFEFEILGDPAQAEVEPGRVRFALQYASHGSVPDDPVFASNGFQVVHRFAAIPAVTLVGPASKVLDLARGHEGLASLQYDEPIDFLLTTATIATRARDVWGNAYASSAGAPLTFDVDGDGTPDVIDGSGVGVAVVDSGINGLHPDLLYEGLEVPGGPPGRLVTCMSVGLDYFSQENPPYCDPVGGHGTHVAGIVGGSGWASARDPTPDGNPARPIVGAAPGADLYSVAIGVEALAAGFVLLAAQGLDWVYINAESRGIRIATNSWGIDETCNANLAAVNTNLVNQISTSLIQERGVTVLFAAGNSGSTGLYGTNPHAQNPTPGLISVANYDDGNTGDRDAQIATGSSDGCVSTQGNQNLLWTWPDVAAPGTNIMSTGSYTSPLNALFGAEGLIEPLNPLWNFFTCNGQPADGALCGDDAAMGMYYSLSGTSMSTPHVAGVVALMLQANPDLTPAQVEEILVETARPWQDTVAARGTSGTSMWGPSSVNNHQSGFADRTKCKVSPDDALRALRGDASINAEFASFTTLAATFGNPQSYVCRDYKRGAGLVDAYAAVQRAWTMRNGAQFGLHVLDPAPGDDAGDLSEGLTVRGTYRPLGDVASPTPESGGLGASFAMDAADATPTQNTVTIDSPPEASPVAGLVTVAGTAVTVAGQSETNNPVAMDAVGDSLAPTSDIGNVWINGDTGSAFDVHLRIRGTQGQSAPSVPLVLEAEYGIDFELARTGVAYRLRFHREPTVNVFELKAETADGGSICTLSSVLQGSTFASNVVKFHVDYTDLLLNAPPTVTGVLCNTTTGNTAVAGDVLQGVRGISSHVVGIIDFGSTVGDTTSPGTYTVGPRVTCPPECPTSVSVTVNGASAGTSTVSGGAWSKAVDFAAFSPDASNNFLVRAQFGSVTATRTFVAQEVTPNVPPTAVASAMPLTATTGTLVTLVSDGSTDPDGSIAAYAWSQSSGPGVTLAGAASPTATFVAPTVAAATPLSFRLVVTDDRGATAEASTSVLVEPPPATEPRVTITIGALTASTPVSLEGGAWEVHVPAPVGLAPGSHVLLASVTDGTSTVDALQQRLLVGAPPCSVGYATWASDADGTGWGAPVNTATDVRQVRVGGARSGLDCSTLRLGVQVADFQRADVEAISAIISVDLREAAGTTDYVVNFVYTMRQNANGFGLVNPFVEFVRDGVILFDTNTNAASRPSGGMTSFWVDGRLDATIPWSLLGTLRAFGGFDASVMEDVGDTAAPTGLYEADTLSSDRRFWAATGFVPPDTTAPTIAPHDDVVVEATGPDGAHATFETPTATDETDGEVLVACAPESGSLYPLGPTPVTCTASDAAGNVASSMFHVRVVDTTPPELVVPDDIEVVATSSQGNAVTYGASATDVVDGDVPVVCAPAPGAVFGLGSTFVECEAVDATGNTGAASFLVLVAYDWSGFLPPVASDGSSRFHAGKNVPVKFGLVGDSAPVTDAQATLWVRADGSPDESEARSNRGDNAFRYDAETGQYVMTWSTKGLQPGAYWLRADLGDGLERSVRVTLE